MDFEEDLIEEVRKRPLLYDLSLEDYKNLRKKAKAWQEVAAKVKLNEAQCKKRWKGLRDCYQRCRKMARHSAESAAGTAPKRKWRHLEIMSFLEGTQCSRRSPENICLGELLDESSVNEQIKFEQISGEDQINDTCSMAESEEAPSTSSHVQKPKQRDKFEKFLKLATESISKTCAAFAEQKADTNSTTVLFMSLANKIASLNMPLNDLNNLEASVFAFVFSEIQKYLDKDL